jgi:hypothetical protein
MCALSRVVGFRHVSRSCRAVASGRKRFMRGYQFSDEALAGRGVASAVDRTLKTPAFPDCAGLGETRQLTMFFPERMLHRFRCTRRSMMLSKCPTRLARSYTAWWCATRSRRKGRRYRSLGGNKASGHRVKGTWFSSYVYDVSKGRGIRFRSGIKTFSSLIDGPPLFALVSKIPRHDENSYCTRPWNTER